MTLNLPLMQNNILKEDLDRVIEHLNKPDPKLTQGENVKMFEEEWSEWLGVKYSVFVNSGSSANMLTLAALKTEISRRRRGNCSSFNLGFRYCFSFTIGL